MMVKILAMAVFVTASTALAEAVSPARPRPQPRASPVRRLLTQAK